jgi:hypothetical protein
MFPIRTAHRSAWPLTGAGAATLILCGCFWQGLRRMDDLGYAQFA